MPFFNWLFIHMKFKKYLLKAHCIWSIHSNNVQRARKTALTSVNQKRTKWQDPSAGPKSPWTHSLTWGSQHRQRYFTWFTIHLLSIHLNHFLIHSLGLHHSILEFLTFSLSDAIKWCTMEMWFCSFSPFTAVAFAWK